MTSEVSLPRLYALRAMYALIVVGLAATIWPGVLAHGPDVPLMNGVVSSLLAAMSLLAALGLRYPLQMIPVLLFELIWKIIWLTAFALPLWWAGAMDARTWGTVTDCIPVVLIPLVLPWGYVWRHYVRRPGEAWRKESRP